MDERTVRIEILRCTNPFQCATPRVLAINDRTFSGCGGPYQTESAHTVLLSDVMEALERSLSRAKENDE